MMQQTNNKLVLACFVLAIMSLMIAVGIGRFVFTPILPIMLDESIVPLSEAIWLSSANYIGYFVGAMSLFKNSRHLLFLMLGLVTVTFATFLSSSHDFTAIFIFRFLTGMAGAWGLISISAWAVPWLKQRNIKRVGFIYTGVGAGIALSGTICSLLILNKFSSTQLWYAVGGLALLLLTNITILLRYVLTRTTASAQTTSIVNDKINSEKTHNATEAVHITIPASAYDSIAVWRLAVAYGLFGFGYIIPATFLPKIAKDIVSGDAFLLVWPIFGIASVIGICLSQIFHNVSDLRIWRIAQTCVGVATLLPLFSQTIISLLITALLVGGSFMLVIMSILKIAAQTNRNYNVVALVTASFALGQLAGPLPALLLTGTDIWNYILPLSAIASLSGVAFIWNMTISEN